MGPEMKGQNDVILNGSICRSSSTSSIVSTRIPYARSCLQECSTPVEAEVSGTIPNWISGYLLRNGPGLRKIGQDEYKHLFDGLALMHQFSIDGGRVTYANKFLRSQAYERCMKANRIVVSDFGTRAFPDPCKSILQRYMSYFSFKQFTDNASVNFFPVGDEIYATTETPQVTRIDPKTLQSCDPVDLANYIAVNTMTAHPHLDEHGNILNMGSKFGKNSSYNIIKVPKNGSFEKASILASIPVENSLHPSYYHSFSITDKHLIFIEQPLVISVPSITFNHLLGRSFSESLKWMPQLKTKFYIVSRETGKILPQKYIAEPFAFFHSINAYEDNGHVVVDLCCYNDGNVVTELYSKSLKDDEVQNLSAKEIRTRYGLTVNANARRYVLPLLSSNQEYSNGANINKLNYSSATAVYKEDSSVFCSHEDLTEEGPAFSEFPRINYEKFNGKPYRYFYSIARREDDHLNHLIKFDLKTRTKQIWLEEDHYASEPVFINHPDGVDEDDGAILSAVLSETDETKGFLVVINAKDFQELGRAYFQTPSAIPSDFHGIFINKS